MFILKVHGPNLHGPFDTLYDTHLIEDPATQTEIEDGYLIVKLPAYEGRPAVKNDPARPSVSVPARPATGPITITYPPGQWSKTTVYEKRA